MAKFYPLTVKAVDKETEDCVSILFEVPLGLQAEYRFTHGQHLTLKTEINGEEVRRSYSICSSPLEETLKVAVKHIPNGIFSSFANHALKAGDSLDVMTPMGRFFTELNPENQKNYVAFAAGSGITPVISIIKTILMTEPKSTVTLLFGNKNKNSIIFKEEIEGLKNKYMSRLSVYHILSREYMDAPFLNGRIDAEKCNTFLRYLNSSKTIDECFICGPEEMIHSVRKTLEDAGINKKNIHFELFAASTPATPPQKKEKIEDTGKMCEATVRLDGRTFDMKVAYTGDSILDAALKVGADLPFACKGGVCCTCRAKLIEGEVIMDVNYGLEQDEVAQGFILTCQAHPISEKIVVDFDAR